MAEEIKNLSQEQSRTLESLSKAYVTGHEINPANQENAAALRTEFLDDQVTMLTYTEADLEFFRQVPRKPSTSTVAQYDVYLSHGGSGNSRFVREVDISNVTDPHIRKKKVDMKFLSDTKQISLAAQLTDNIQDPVRILTDDGIINIAKSIEWASFYGDSDLSDDPTAGSGVQFDGLAKLIDQNNIVDARGETLSEAILNQAAVLVGKGYGTPTDAYMPIGVHADFVNKYLTRQTQIMANNSDSVDLGFNVQAFNSARGRIRLHGSTVMELENILDEVVATDPNAPLAPAVVATAKTAQGGNFSGVDELAAYSYKVVVNGDKSASRASEAVTATVAAATGGVELAITVNGMYQQRPQYVSIYRQGKQTGQYYLIANVAMSQAVAGVITFVDKNAVLPETSDVFVGEMSPSVIHLFEFLPMTRVPLAQMNATVTFTVLWYGSLALRCPRKFVRVKNVGMINTPDVHNNY